MPKLNGTGPFGAGPRTGRGFGPCGMGYGRGFGFGTRQFFSPKNELAALEEEERMLEEELAIIREEKEALSKDK